MEVDLHIHSAHSPDSIASPAKIVRRARKLGLAAIAVTDHNSWDGWKDAQSVSGDTPLIVPGAELKTTNGDLLALFVEEPITTRNWAEAIEAIRAQDGVAIVPHPADSKRLTMEDIKLADGLEAFNAKCSRRSNERSSEIARRLRLPGIASSDAHSVAAVGNGRTWVTEFSSVDELRTLLLKDPRISRAETTNPILHYGNAALCFGLKGIWKR